MTDETLPTFKELGFNDKILKAIEDIGYTHPTPIQAAAIPSVLMTRDVVGIAQTGTGKTASFTLPMIEMLAGGRVRARMPRSLILTPTRELAMQIADNFEQYGKYHDLTYAVLVGGIAMDPQIQKLERGVDVLIATPGRLLDLFSRGNVLLADIKILVIDEADRMLDMGFIPDLEKIISFLPPLRQTLLFSATMPSAIRDLAQKFLSNPKEISVAPPSSPTTSVEHVLVTLPEKEKKAALSHILSEEDVESAFIFCNRKKDIDGLHRSLERQGIKNIASLHGDMDQHNRSLVLEKFKSGDINILVCSDVAGRGLDVANVSHVFNYNVPQNPEDYIHRIGRTGRAGNTGKAFTFATKADGKYVLNIEKLTGSKIPRHNIEGFDSVDIKTKGGDKKRGPRTQKSKGNGQSKNNKHTRPNKKDNATKPKQKQKNTAPVKGFGDDIPDFFQS